MTRDPDEQLKMTNELIRQAGEQLETLGSRVAAVIAPMPNKPKTPMHSFRVEDELWEAAKRRAEERGETLTDALRKFLRRYTATKREGGK